ncbi:SDR family oxidoreductase [Eubacteriales bacterium OttesenSCG-928-M02]|nr:SDR family oxidoreductase [Eubacteriales bacterium OttesenSCG-928-M02]
MDLGLKGKVALVTGGARGIGAGICEVLAEEGANLVVNYRSDPDECEAFAYGLGEAHGVEVLAVQADISREEEVEMLFEKALSRFSDIPLVVNNAGAMGRSAFAHMETAEWMRFVDTNLNGMFYVSRAFCRHRLAVKGPGRGVNVLSKSAVSTNSTNNVHYCATKAGGIGLTRGLTNELMAEGIVFNAIMPGYVRSHSAKFESGTEVGEQRRSLIPSGKFGTPREMGDITAFLLSERASQIAGVILDATGGLLL